MSKETEPKYKFNVEQKVIIIHRLDNGGIKIFQTEIEEICIGKEGVFYNTLAADRVAEADVFEKLDNDFKKAIAKTIIKNAEKEEPNFTLPGTGPNIFTNPGSGTLVYGQGVRGVTTLNSDIVACNNDISLSSLSDDEVDDIIDDDVDIKGLTGTA